MVFRNRFAQVAAWVMFAAGVAFLLGVSIPSYIEGTDVWKGMLVIAGPVLLVLYRLTAPRVVVTDETVRVVNWFISTELPIQTIRAVAVGGLVGGNPTGVLRTADSAVLMRCFDFARRRTWERRFTEMAVPLADEIRARQSRLGVPAEELVQVDATLP